jgi:hypothetical protein
MRVRISFDALRLCLLVAAGVTSGYLWRAAFESSSPAEQRVAATPRVAEPTPVPPVVRIQPRPLTVPHKAAVSRHVAPRVVVNRAPGVSTALASRPVRISQPPTATPVAQPPKPTPTPTPTPTPKPTPAPTPPQPTTTTPPQPPTSTTPVSAPVEQVGSSPPPTTTTTPSETAPSDDSKPGWGNGDKNHDHTGPGGKGK